VTPSELVGCLLVIAIGFLFLWIPYLASKLFGSMNGTGRSDTAWTLTFVFMCGLFWSLFKQRKGKSATTSKHGGARAAETVLDESAPDVVEAKLPTPTAPSSPAELSREESKNASISMVWDPEDKETLVVTASVIVSSSGERAVYRETFIKPRSQGEESFIADVRGVVKADLARINRGESVGEA
jgi:hypothetical protein